MPGFNATGQDYFGVYDEISKYNVQLNTVERLWAVCLPFPNKLEPTIRD